MLDLKTDKLYDSSRTKEDEGRTFDDFFHNL